MARRGGLAGCLPAALALLLLCAAAAQALVVQQSFDGGVSFSPAGTLSEEQARSLLFSTFTSCAGRAAAALGIADARVGRPKRARLLASAPAVR